MICGACENCILGCMMSGCCPTRLPAAGRDASVVCGPPGRDMIGGIGIRVGIDVTAGRIACGFQSTPSVSVPSGFYLDS